MDFDDSNSFKCEVSDFGRATESEREPAAIADVDITEAVADFHDAASVFEDWEERNAENPELRAVSMTRQSQCEVIFRAVVDKFGVMR